MILSSAAGTPDSGKGWFVGPWNSPVPVAIGWADRGVDQPHRHDQMHEVYLVARGNSTARVAAREVHLGPGDMLAVEPGEAHTFLDSTEDYLHFVIQAPFRRRRQDRTLTIHCGARPRRGSQRSRLVVEVATSSRV